LDETDNCSDGGAPGQGKGIQGIFSLVNPAGFWGD
jgi:hypothetical protein